MKPDKNLYYYLATPYYHKSRFIRYLRYRAAVLMKLDLLMQGILAYSPIVEHHPIAVRGNLDGSFNFWQAIDRNLIDRFDGFILGLFNGWESSQGMQEEFNFAESLGKELLVFDGKMLFRAETSPWIICA